MGKNKATATAPAELVPTTSTSTADAIAALNARLAAHGEPPRVDLIDEAEVAKILHCTVRSVQNLRWVGGSTRGKLGYTKIGKKVLYNRYEVLAWLAAQRREGR